MRMCSWLPSSVLPRPASCCKMNDCSSRHLNGVSSRLTGYWPLRSFGGGSAGSRLLRLRSVLSLVTSKIRIVPAAVYQHRLADAERLSPDPADAPYLALALHLGLPLWSNDSALRKQMAVPIYSTQKLIEFLRGHSR